MNIGSITISDVFNHAIPVITHLITGLVFVIGSIMLFPEYYIKLTESDKAMIKNIVIHELNNNVEEFRSELGKSKQINSSSK
ncbi:MAG: hypothetical protein BWK73_18695 [Thiothrix lacustris]|uniref:Uncharacterized protein n=1 Tax=Thiothrix lacustris TaxID=525917 RepID=A0A1Y1QPX5_9GAMM|nr:MAG: hypothetical protein BWK73_18695 [Thiothrix lacustris]